MTGVAGMMAAAVCPVGQLASVSNGGTLCAFFFVALAVMTLRRTDPNRKRVFQTPAVWIVGPLAAAGCLMPFAFLTLTAQMVFFGWGAIGPGFHFFPGPPPSHGSAWGRRRGARGLEVGLAPALLSLRDPSVAGRGDPRHQRRRGQSHLRDPRCSVRIVVSDASRGVRGRGGPRWRAA